MALLRTEWFKAIWRRRTFVMVVLMTVLPLIIVAGFGDRPPRPRDIGDDVGAFRLMRVSGTFAAPALLRWQFDVLLLVIAALFAGDAIAGDASYGNLRYLLTRPVRRARLLATKTFVAFSMVLGLVTVITFATAIAGAVKFGVRSVHVDGVPAEANLGVAIPTFDLTIAEQWLRCGLLALFLTLGFGAVLGLGILFSTIADAPTGAVGGAIAVHIVSNTLQAVPALGRLRYGLPTYYEESWRALFVEDRWFTADIARNLLVNGIWFALAYGAAHWWFGRKDIHT
jgi:ABC-2 type transport system permease protein